MEVTELKSILKTYDQKMSETNHLNREILKKILITKPEKRLDREKLRAAYHLLSPFILALIIIATNTRFNITTNFYIGMGGFIIGWVVVYIRHIHYFLILRKVDFSENILFIKKKVIELEKYRLKTARMSYLIAPLMIGSVFLMVFTKLLFTTEVIIMFIMTGFVFVCSVYYTFKYSLPKQFTAFNKEIEELEKLEK